MYFLRVPTMFRRWMPEGKWDMPPGVHKLSLYLTFDDGPHPEVTPFVLAQLAKYKAKATFFCVGKNVADYPEIYEQIIQEGHQIGNHTYQHLNGWQSGCSKYLIDIKKAAAKIDSTLFRPPYGRIRNKQAKALKESGMQLIYWSLLSGDFDENISPQKCLDNVSDNMQPGDIIVFHDSEKARQRLEFVLPRILEVAIKQGWKLKSL